MGCADSLGSGVTRANCPKLHEVMTTKRFAVRIQEGARPHLKIVKAEGPDEAASMVIEQLDGEGDRLLGARIAIWEHGTLHKNLSPLFIKSIRPFEATPDVHVVQTIREEARRARWLETQALIEEEKARQSHHFEGPFERWLEEHCNEEETSFFSLPLEARRECIELRDHLKHVPLGEMTEVQARFAGVVTSYEDLYRYEMHSVQEHLAASLEMIHHDFAGEANEEGANDDRDHQRGRLADLLGGSGHGGHE